MQKNDIFGFDHQHWDKTTMETNIRHLIDFKKVDPLLEGFSKATGFVTAILDLEGNVLSKSGWRQMCTEFHRVNPETSKKCTISDTELANKMGEGEKYHFYKCLNGLVDVAVPVIINGEHVANLFSGQFFFEEPDSTFFKKQAEKYGFDEGKYLAALKNVPVVSQEKVITAMDFLLNMTQMISDMTFQKLEQIELNQNLSESVEKAKENEEKYRAMYNSAPLSYQSLDENGCFIDINPMWLKTLGYERDEVIGKWYGDFLHPDYAEHFRINFPAFKKRGYVSDVQFKLRRKDNTYIYVSFEGCVGYTPEGKFKQTYCVFKDITEQKAIENALIKAIEQTEESEEKFRLLHENAGLGIGYYSPDGIILSYNQIASKHMNGNPEDFIGKSIFDLFPKESADFYFNRIRNAIVSPQPMVYEDLVQLLKEDKWFLSTYTKIENSQRKVLGVQIISQDISEIKKAEIELHKAKEKAEESEENLSITLHSIGDGVITTDKFGMIDRMNPVALKLCGWQADEITGKPLTEVFKIFNTVTREPVPNPVEEVIEYGAVVGLAKYTVLVAKDGREYQIADTAAPIKDKDGNIKGIVLVFSDESEKYAAEEEIRFQAHITDNSPVITAFHDKELNLVWANSAYQKATGLSLEEIKGRKCYQVWNLSKPCSGCPVIKAIETGENASHELTPDNQDHWPEAQGYWLSQAAPVRDKEGAVIGAIEFAINITELRKKEEEQIRLLNIIEKSRNEVYIFDEETLQFEFVNHGALDNLGYTLPEMKSMTPYDIKPEITEGTFREMIKPLQDGAIERQVFETVHQRKNGSTYPVEVFLQLQKTGNKKVFLALINDITERKQAEAGIQGAQALSNTIIDSIPGTFYLLDEHGRYAHWNAYQREVILGKPEEQMAGLNALDTIHPEDRALIQAKIATVLQVGKDEALEGRVLLRGGPAFIWMLMTGRRMTIAGRPFLVGIGIDITERKLAEEELLLKNLVFDSSIAANSVADLSGTITQANDAFLRIWGYSGKDEVVGKPISEFLNEPNEAVAIVDSLNKGGQWEGDYTAKRKDGSTYIAHGLATVVRGKGDDIIGYQSAVLDITERKQTEEKLLKQLNELRRWQEVTLGRKDRNRQLKQEVNELLTRFGETIRYPSVEANPIKEYPDEIR